MSLISKIRSGEIDCNQQDNFIGAVIKGILWDLTRVSGIPHTMIHTGDDTMWLFERGYDASKEPVQVTNQDGIYQKIPYCAVDAGGVTIMPDQLSNPHVRGVFQMEYENNLYTLNGEFRRLPIQMELNLNYFSDSFTMMLGQIQFILTHLAYINTLYINYMGQSIIVSYKTPDNVDSEYLTDLEGLTSESKLRHLSLAIEVETAIPVFNNRTIMDDNKRITSGGGVIKDGHNQIKIDTTREAHKL